MPPAQDSARLTVQLDQPMPLAARTVWLPPVMKTLPSSSTVSSEVETRGYQRFSETME